MNQIFKKILDIIVEKSITSLRAVTEIESVARVSDVKQSEMTFVQTQMSLIDPFQLKALVVSLLLLAIVLVCRKIRSLDQAVARF